MARRAAIRRRIPLPGQTFQTQANPACTARIADLVNTLAVPSGVSHGCQVSYAPLSSHFPMTTYRKSSPARQRTAPHSA
jgi:hypothetical protein